MVAEDNMLNCIDSRARFKPKSAPGTRSGHMRILFLESCVLRALKMRFQGCNDPLSLNPDLLIVRVPSLQDGKNVPL